MGPGMWSWTSSIVIILKLVDDPFLFSVHKGALIRRKKVNDLNIPCSHYFLWQFFFWSPKLHMQSRFTSNSKLRIMLLYFPLTYDRRILRFAFSLTYFFFTFFFFNFKLKIWTTFIITCLFSLHLCFLRYIL